jgi:hypothetical protein
MKPALPLKLDDEKAERVRRNHAERIDELQRTPCAGAVVIRNVSLVDSTITQVAHGLGRAPVMTIVSPPRNSTSTGRIVDYKGTASAGDPTKFVTLEAIGWGATITVDIEAK